MSDAGSSRGFLPVCTLATGKSLGEFLLLKHSLEQYHDCAWYVGTDRSSEELLRTFPNIQFLNIIDQEEGSHETEDPNMNEHWLRFMLRKFDVIEACLDDHGHALFLDADVFFTGPLERRVFEFLRDSEIDAVLTPHMTNDFKWEASYGHYNAGMFGLRNRRILEIHKSLTERDDDHDLYFEQQPLQIAVQRFTTVSLPIQYNIGWWRFSRPRNKWRLRELGLRDGKLFLLDRPAVCFHLHTLMKSNSNEPAEPLRARVFELMRESENPVYRELLDCFERIERGEFTSVSD